VFEITGPIVRSRLEPDFYKFTMGQLIWRKYRNIETTFTFQNRTSKARIGDIVDVGELREQLDHARSLMFTNSELHYLRGTNEYQQRMFDEGYLEFLRSLRLPDYHVERRGPVLDIVFCGPWSEVTYWETVALSVINEMYYRTLLRSLSKFERETIFADGIRRLRQKIAVLRTGRTFSFPISGRVGGFPPPGSTTSTKRSCRSSITGHPKDSSSGRRTRTRR
jgi:nicotinate phosphoribosyltransferase